MQGDDLVYWSVMEANRINAGRSLKQNVKCRRCGEDEWRIRHGVSEEYRSQYNPGEYIEFTCTKCGYSYESGC